jgi:hypothetical protein
VTELKPGATIAASAGSDSSVGNGAPLPTAILVLPAVRPAQRPRDENPVLAYLARLSPVFRNLLADSSRGAA